MRNEKRQPPKQERQTSNPGQIRIPIKLIRFPQNFSAPVGFKAGASLEACSSKNPSSNHEIDFYPEAAIVRVTWHPPRQPAVSFLVPSIHCFFMAEFGGDDTPKTPKV